MSYDDLNLNEENFSLIHTVGRENYIFLNNDSNYELKQHYSENTLNKFDEKRFRRSYNSKLKFCQERGIIYKFYVVPDKSIVCRDYLPITPKIQKRSYDSISDLAKDFLTILEPCDYYKSDSHINFEGALKYSSHILHDIRSDIPAEKYYEALKENLIVSEVAVEGDICKFSEPDITKKEIIKQYFFPLMEQSGKYEYLDDGFEIPEKFRKVGTRDSVYVKNRFSLSDMKCLLLRDSTSNRFINPLNVFFRSLFAYWDHWNFNTQLVDWYKPDIIMEIRTERFLEGMKYTVLD